jgi:hypothetical protein
MIESCLIMATAFVWIAISALAFRAWYELRRRRRDPEKPGGLAVIDYLLFAPIVLSVLFVILPLLTLPHPGRVVTTVAQGSCAVSVTLIAAYPFAVLDQRLGQKGAIEGALFIGGCALAALGAIAVFWYC